MNEDLEITNSETQAIVDLASKIQPIEIASHAHIKRVALPPGWRLDENDDEKLLPRPSMKSGTIDLDDLDSLTSYINRHKIQDQTTIYCKANYRQGHVKFSCIINDDEGRPDGQQWRNHIARYNPEFSEEWTRWTGANREPHSQIGFATFIEDNLVDIAAIEGMPAGQQLLEMALSFQANQDMNTNQPSGCRMVAST